MAPSMRGAVVALLLAWGCRESEDPELGRQRELLAAQQRKLSAIAEAVRQHRPGPEACDGLVEPGTALLVEAEFLAHLGGGRPDPYAAQGSRYRLLSASKLRGAASETAAPLDRLFKLKQIEDDHRFYAVVVAKERTLPALRGEQFTAGRLTGELVMVDSRDGRPVCSAAFEAASSERVAAASGGRAEAIEKDFELRIRSALEDAAARLNRGFRLELR